MLAADQGDAESMHLLLVHGADYDINNLDGWTPLMLSSEHRFTWRFCFGKKDDGNIEAVEKSGHSALNITVANGNRGFLFTAQQTVPIPTPEIFSNSTDVKCI